MTWVNIADFHCLYFPNSEGFMPAYRLWLASMADMLMQTFMESGKLHVNWFLDKFIFFNNWRFLIEIESRPINVFAERSKVLRHLNSPNHSRTSPLNEFTCKFIDAHLLSLLHWLRDAPWKEVLIEINQEENTIQYSKETSRTNSVIA